MLELSGELETLVSARCGAERALMGKSTKLSHRTREQRVGNIMHIYLVMILADETTKQPNTPWGSLSRDMVHPVLATQ